MPHDHYRSFIAQLSRDGFRAIVLEEHPERGGTPQVPEDVTLDQALRPAEPTLVVYDPERIGNGEEQEPAY